MNNEFVKVFNSDLVGQVCVIRDYCDAEEKELVKFCISIDGCVQELIAKHTYKSKADELFEKITIVEVEKAIKPLVDAFHDIVDEAV